MDLDLGTLSEYTEREQSKLETTTSITCAFLDHLTPDIRFIIYDELISQKHHIEYCTWTPYLNNPSILGPLSETCKKTRGEIEGWFKTKQGLEKSSIFGILDLEITTFWKRFFRQAVYLVGRPSNPRHGFMDCTDPKLLPPYARWLDFRVAPSVSSMAPQDLSKLHDFEEEHRRHTEMHWNRRRPNPPSSPLRNGKDGKVGAQKRRRGRRGRRQRQLGFKKEHDAHDDELPGCADECK